MSTPSAPATDPRQQLRREMCHWADLVLVMDSQQKRELEKTYPAAHGKIFRIGEHARRDVPDPYKQGDVAYADRGIDLLRTLFGD